MYAGRAACCDARPARGGAEPPGVPRDPRRRVTPPPSRSCSSCSARSTQPDGHSRGEPALLLGRSLRGVPFDSRRCRRRAGGGLRDGGVQAGRSAGGGRVLLSALMVASSAVSSRAERRRLRAHRAVPGRPPSLPEAPQIPVPNFPCSCCDSSSAWYAARRGTQGGAENRRDVRVRACAWCISCI